MAIDDLGTLAARLRQQREAVLTDWRAQVRELPSARSLDIPTLNDHIPLLLDELADALDEGSSQGIAQALAGGSPTAHGLQRLQDAFDIEEVVAEYNILRGCIHDLADRHAINVRGRPCHIINRVFDQAIGVALQTYATQRALEIQRRREEYLAFVAHDLRTPLGAISLAVRVLERSRTDAPAGGHEEAMFRTLRRNVQNLEALVGKVLEENASVATESGVKLTCRRFDLWPLVEALTHDLHPVAGTDSTQLSNDVPGELEVYADASLLRRVFQNLIANAIRYTPRGEVRIGASCGEHGAVECWVVDTGSGIPAPLLERVFERGETDPDSPGGSGLGLAIVKTFVEAHGGSVTVESVEGRGATFRFVLPGSGAATAPAA